MSATVASARVGPPALVAERMRERLRADGIDLTRDRDAGERFARAEVRRHNDAALARGAAVIDDEDACVREVLATVAGYGPLQPFLDDPMVEEVCVNAPDRELSSSACRYGQTDDCESAGQRRF
ncbi:MAG: putative conjugal transfer protein [Microbacterium sp.]|nr:putative conjugal transfer protein [Microbacterium sp.]